MKPLRSLLFVPGNEAAWMEKAPQYGADALIFDLEDSVPYADKDTARVLVRQAVETLAARGHTLYVRVNALETGMTGDDPGSDGGHRHAEDSPADAGICPSGRRRGVMTVYGDRENGLCHSMSCVR